MAVGERVFNDERATSITLTGPFDQVTIHPVTVALQIPGNPVTMEMIWLTDTDPEINFRAPPGNYTHKTAQLSKQLDALCKEIPYFTQYLESKGGRPKGSGTQAHKKKDSLNKAYLAHSKGASWSGPEIRAITHAAPNTVINWRRSFLRQVVPEINRMRIEGFSKDEIADNLDVSSALIDSYLDDPLGPK